MNKHDHQLAEWREAQYRRYQEKLAEEENLRNETYEFDKAVCPNCGAEIEDMWEYGMNDGDDIEIECPNCGVNIKIICHVTIAYTTVLQEEEDEGR